jgi:phage antirepressor YoqD-like protein
MAKVNSPVTKCRDYTTTRKVKVDAYLKTNGPSRPTDIAQAIGVETKRMYKFFDRHKAFYENPEYGLWKLKNVNLNSGSTSEVILTSPDTNENKL